MMKFVRAALATFILLFFPAQAGTDAFSGNWQSRSAHTDIRFIQIAPGGGNALLLRVYGDCQPRVCLWGAVTARPKDAGMPPEQVTEVSATLYFAYAARTITLTLDKGQIRFTADYHFRTNAGTDHTEHGVLAPSLWPAPWEQSSWEVPDALGDGWGGGTQGARMVPPRQTCQSFDIRKAVLRPAGKGWQADADGVALFYTAHPREKAQDALVLLRHYHINEVCRAGGLSYWKTNGNFPALHPVSRSCLHFSPTTAHIARLGREWYVVDGDASVLNLHDSKQNAFSLLAMIRHYHLTTKCVSDWPDPVLTYWLKD